MKLAVIGRGRVGTLLGPALVQAGHEVRFGLRDPTDPRHAGDDGIARLRTPDAVAASDGVVLAVDWSVALAALADCGPMAGKLLIDCTNPLKYSPEAGLELALGFDTSAGEIIAANSDARTVKTLNQVGALTMARARDLPVPPVQFVSGDDAGARAEAAAVVESLGFRAVDYGPMINARKLEPLAMISIDLMFKHGQQPLFGFALVEGTAA